MAGLDKVRFFLLLLFFFFFFFSFFFFFFHDYLVVPCFSEKFDGVCISPGGRFPPFPFEGKPPRAVKKGPKDLSLCQVFKKNTCCDVTQTHPAFISVRKLAASGEASKECLHLWELLECSICDPHIGVTPGPPLICASFCDMVMHACSHAYFSMDTKNHLLTPCASNDIICGRATEWVSNGTELCHFAGFSVYVPVDSNKPMEGPFCFGGNSRLDSISRSWRTTQSGMPEHTESKQFIGNFYELVRDMPISERVSWAVGGMVLTAGVLLISKRKSHSYRQKQAAILRTAKRLEARVNQQSSLGRKLGK